jgi:predicted DNA-binding antitoxin AbrB/MazE fold protein
MMTVKLHGIVRGKIIELNEPVDLPEGTEIEITILERSYKDAWERQRNLMEQGFHMGQRQKIKRDDLYERD